MESCYIDFLHEEWIRKGLVERSAYYALDYLLFDRAKYIQDHLDRGGPVAIVWVPSSTRLYCRRYPDIFGVPDILGIEEIPTMFTGVKGMEHLRLFLIPYLLTGYEIPEELERD